jgi:branched-chain amino acid aminotransferase
MVYPFYLKNNILVSQYDTLQDFNFQGQIIYEVIRIINGKVLFFEDHLSRFHHSALKSGIAHPVPEKNIRENILSLIQKNKITHGNVKFLIQKIKQDNIQFYAFGIPHYYPSEKEYMQGINATLYCAERKNPEIKVLHPDLKIKIDRLVDEKKVFEALLVDSNGNITEGSKTNFFLIKNDTVFTSPESDVLSGVTRKNLMDLFKEHNINHQEVRIPVRELKVFETAFISGTSPKVLPVNQIDDLHFDVNLPLLRKIMKCFDLRIENYLKSI